MTFFPPYRRRGLQKITIRDNSDEDKQTPSDEESSGTAPQEDPTRIVVCPNNSNNSTDGNIFAVTTTVEFTYAVQYTYDNSTIAQEDVVLLKERNLPEWVDGATVDTVAGLLCGGNSTNGCFLSVSTGSRDVWVNDDPELCDPLATTAQEENQVNATAGNQTNATLSAPSSPSPSASTCSLYSGTIKVTHSSSSECSASPQQIQDSVLDLLTDPQHTEPLRQAAQDNAQDPVAVDSLAFGPALPSPTAAPTVGQVFIAVGAQKNIMVYQQGGMTPGGKTLISFLALLVAGLFAVCLVWRRRQADYRRRLEEDLKSCKTEWSSGNNTGNQSYLRPDFYDLALTHSKLNVHHCASGTCRVCRGKATNSNLGVVDMHRVPRGTNMRPVAGIVAQETRNRSRPYSQERMGSGMDSSLSSHDMPAPQQQEQDFSFHEEAAAATDVENVLEADMVVQPTYTRVEEDHDNNRVDMLNDEIYNNNTTASYSLEDDMGATQPSYSYAEEGTMSANDEWGREQDGLTAPGNDVGNSQRNPAMGLGDVLCSPAYGEDNQACGGVCTGVKKDDKDEEYAFVRVEEESRKRLGGWQKFKNPKRPAAAREVVL